MPRLPGLAAPLLVLAFRFGLCLAQSKSAFPPPATAPRKRPPPSFPVPVDARPPGCDLEVVDPDGTNFTDVKVSIIIPYKNEKWEHIRGSLDSILYYTPKKYLSEIMFVSDGNSEKTMYIAELQRMSKLVTFVHFPPPGIGLIEAKMRAVGAAAVQSTVLVFLEPHIRVNRQWLQPLLRRVRLHPHVLVMPALDLIPVHDFNQYIQGGPGRWRFEWNLNLAFTEPSGTAVRTHEAYLSPATSGGIFAIRRDWWNELGFYDYGMKGWGGDHVEATFKVWRCGGHIEIAPCSRIGHLFREPAQRPYPVVIDQVVQNYNRMAAVWFEGHHLQSFYKVKPEARSMDKGNLTEQLLLKERLGCKSMDWYLENVDVELGWEEEFICIPGCKTSPDCCPTSKEVGRSTLDRIMPPNEFTAAMARAKPLPDDVHRRDDQEL